LEIGVAPLQKQIVCAYAVVDRDLRADIKKISGIISLRFVVAVTPALTPSRVCELFETKKKPVIETEKLLAAVFTNGWLVGWVVSEKVNSNGLHGDAILYGDFKFLFSLFLDTVQMEGTRKKAKYDGCIALLFLYL
jgi:hypothetical protein